MPRRDGTGPAWRSGSGVGSGRLGGSRPGAGPSGDCICPNCGAKVSHQRGAPCYNLSCPRCGTNMVRD